MQLFALLFTVFIDSLGFGLVFPLFSPLIVNNEGGMFGPDVTLMTRGLIFGLLVSTYCVGQFFGGPFLGGLSDRKGRRKVLVGAMWLGFLGYLVAGLGVILQSLTVLFVARLAVGISAGTFPVVQSVIADTSTKENKARKFGMVGMSCWTGFVIGPFLGGRLAPFGATIPFIAAAFFCFFSALTLLFFLKETLPQNPGEKIRIFKGIFQIKKAFMMPTLRSLFIVMFVFCLGWGFFTEFSPIFLTRRLGFDVKQIANFYAWVGCCIAISQGILIRPLLKRMPAEKLLLFGLVMLGSVLPIMLFIKGSVGLFWLIPLIALAQAFIFPTAATLVSNESSKETQGEMLGINNSVQWVAIALPPLFSGGFVALYPHLVIIVGSSCMMLGFLIFLKTFLKQRRKAKQAEENSLE